MEHDKELQDNLKTFEIEPWWLLILTVCAINMNTS